MTGEEFCVLMVVVAKQIYVGQNFMKTHTHNSASEYTTGENRMISVDYTNVSFLVLTL